MLRWFGNVSQTYANVYVSMFISPVRIFMLQTFLNRKLSTELKKITVMISNSPNNNVM